MTASARAIEALGRGQVVVLPTDTVYGLVARGDSEAAVANLYAVKGRGARQPTAVIVASVDSLLALFPELPERPRAIVEALLPGPLTLVVPNPARRLPWLNREHPETIGVRVPILAGVGREVLDEIGVLAATSANLPGEPDCHTVDDLPAELADRVAVIVDGGPLPGTPSTVVELTGSDPRILREGAVPSGEVLRRIATLTGS